VRLAAVFSPGATANNASLGVDAFGNFALAGVTAADTAVGVIRLFVVFAGATFANAGEGVLFSIAIGVIRRFVVVFGGAWAVDVCIARAGLGACFGAGLPTNDCSCFFVIFEIGGQLFFFNSRARLYTAARVSPFCLRAIKKRWKKCAFFV